MSSNSLSQKLLLDPFALCDAEQAALCDVQSDGVCWSHLFSPPALPLPFSGSSTWLTAEQVSSALPLALT